MAPKGRAATPRAQTERPAPMSGAHFGRIAGPDEGHGVLVDFEGNPGPPVPARATVALTPEAVAAAIAARTPVVLLFERGDPGCPILVGLVQPSAGEALLAEVLGEPAAAPAPSAEARLDGRRVVLEGSEEVVLRCGEASITLRRDGKVEVRGARIVSTARGTHRIRGGAVQIN